MEYLVVPRVIAMVIMAPVQCLLFFTVALWSGQISSTHLYQIPPGVFWISVQDWLALSDLPFIESLFVGINYRLDLAGPFRASRLLSQKKAW